MNRVSACLVSITHYCVAVLNLFVDGRLGCRTSYGSDMYCLIKRRISLGMVAENSQVRLERRHGQNRIELFLEPHVEHLVRFIEDDTFDLIEGDGSALGEVDQKRPLGTACGVCLSADVGAAIDGCGADALVVFGEQLDLLGDLLTQFTRRCKH